MIKGELTVSFSYQSLSSTFNINVKYFIKINLEKF